MLIIQINVEQVQYRSNNIIETLLRVSHNLKQRDKPLSTRRALQESHHPVLDIHQKRNKRRVWRQSGLWRGLSSTTADCCTASSMDIVSANNKVPAVLRVHNIVSGTHSNSCMFHWYKPYTIVIHPAISNTLHVVQRLLLLFLIIYLLLHAMLLVSLSIHCVILYAPVI